MLFFCLDIKISVVQRLLINQHKELDRINMEVVCPEHY